MNKLEDSETLSHGSVSQEYTDSVSSLLPLPEQAVAQAAAPQHVPVAETPTSASGTCELPDLQAAASASSGRGMEKAFVPEAPGHEKLCATALDSLGKQDEEARPGKQKCAPPSPAVSDTAVEDTVQSLLPQVQTKTAAVCLRQQDLTQAQQAAGEAKADEPQEATNRVHVTPQSGPDPQVHIAAMAAHREAVPASSGRGYTPGHQEGIWASQHSAVLNPCIPCQVVGARMWVHHETRGQCQKSLLSKTELLKELGRSCAAHTGQSLADFWEITRQIKKLRKQRAGQEVPCVSHYEPQDMAEEEELEEGGDEEPKIKTHWVNPRITGFCQGPQAPPQQTPGSSSITDTEASGESDGQAQSTALPASRHTDAKAKASALAGGAWDDGHGTLAPTPTLEEENASASPLLSERSTAARDESQRPCLHDPTACAISLEDTAQALVSPAGGMCWRRQVGRPCQTEPH